MPKILTVFDPAASYWVEASAGTGKTKLLTDRLLSLLLQGIDPSRILCLTFTNAAACEMTSRIEARVKAWVSCPHDVLDHDLKVLGADCLQHHARARSLFWRLLEGTNLRIQTLHSFCQSLLRLFPLEAGLTPGFRVLDEAQSRSLWSEAFYQALKTSDIHYFVGRFSESAFRQLMEGFYGERQALKRCPATKEALWAFFDLPPHTTLENREASFLQGIPLETLQAMASLEPRFAPLWEARQKPEFFSLYIRHFLTLANEPRARLFTKAEAQKLAPFVGTWEREQVRVVTHLEKVQALAICQGSAALSDFLEKVLLFYEEIKREKNALDYDDLILKSTTLLKNESLAPWVLYKMDAGFDHVLVDEAQDTNPHQWDIIQALTAEFFEISDHPRSLFVVGDAKQSIFSFQGAEPRHFAVVRDLLATKCQRQKKTWVRVALEKSYRSTPPILESVDIVCNTEIFRQSLFTPQVTHEPHRLEAPGLVEIWPLVAGAPEPKGDPWTPSPLGAPPAYETLANLMAEEIATWIRKGRWVPSQNRAVQARDILILVRTRTAFTQAMVQALKRRGIGVAGSDVLRLQEELAVWDLVALAEWICLPSDDMTLARLLKSPLIGLGEEDLFHLAHQRGKSSLWERLQERNPEIAKKLTHFKDLADQLSPAAFYAHLLFHQGADAHLRAHFGSQVSDVLLQFMEAVKAFENGMPPTLQGFLVWFQSQDIVVKRNLEHSVADEVRILTAHSSKGLQAPIVFLPDTTTVPSLTAPFYWHPSFMCWAEGHQKAKALEPLQQPWRQAILAEYHRLLYVAMTRAQDALYIAGTTTPPPPACWYMAVRTALAPTMHEVPHPLFEEPCLRRGDAPLFHQESLSRPATPPALPEWMHVMPEIPQRPLLLTPSSPTQGGNVARGERLHAAMALLPAEDAIQRAHDLWGPDEERDEIMRRLRDAPELRFLWEWPGFNEVSLEGVVDGQLIRGRIDRLVRNEETGEMVIVDYKFGRTLHEDHSHRQLTLYRRLVEEINPQHAVRVALLTSQPTVPHPRLVWLP